MDKIFSFFGIFVMIAIAWFLSKDRKLFPWRMVAWALSIQLFIAVLILKTPFGKTLFDWAQKTVMKLNDFAQAGAALVFGPLGNPQSLQETFGPANGVIFAISISSVIILVSSLSSLFYHWGILQKIVQSLAWLMQKTLKTSGAESLAAAANVFVGHTEAPLVIRPFLKNMTESELMSMTTCGMATIAGSVMAAYASFGAPAGHLLTASLMSAPAALMMAKIMIPETEISETAAKGAIHTDTNTCNSIDALCLGASDGLKLSLNVMAMLIAFTAVVELCNYVLLFLQRPFGSEISLQVLLGWINAPLVRMIGVPAQDCLLVGEILGERIVLNEFIGYLHLTREVAQLDERSFRLATYALCGFANFGSVAIMIGGISSLVPERRRDLAGLGLKCMVGGILTCYLTAAMVGVLT